MHTRPPLSQLSSHRRSRARSISRAFLVATLCVTGAFARADTLVDIGFEFIGPFSKDTDANSDASLLNWSMDAMGLHPGVGNPPESAYGRTSYSTIGAARTNEQVFRFTLTPHAGYRISITSVAFDVAAERSPGTSQTAQMFGYSDRDAQSTPIAAGFAIDSTANDGPSPFTTFSTDLSSNVLYQNVGDQIVFSFYIFGTDPIGIAYFDNIRIAGTTAVVPEPSTYGLIAVGALALIGGAARRSKQRYSSE